MSGGGSSKTTIVKPSLDAGTKRVLQGGQGFQGLYDRAESLYQNTTPWKGMTLGEEKFKNYGYDTVSRLKYLGDKAASGSRALMSMSQAPLGDYGGWQDTLRRMGSGQVNPQIGGMVQAAQNSAMRGYDRVSQSYQHAYERMARDAQNQYQTSLRSAQGAYTRAAQEATQGFQSGALAAEQGFGQMARSAGQEFDRAVLQSGQELDRSAMVAGNQFDASRLASMQDFERMSNLATNQVTDARTAAMNDYERSRLAAISGYERAAVPIKAELEQYFSDQDQTFNEQMLPTIRGQASQVGGYGGSRHQMADAIAARDVAEAKLQQTGRVGEAFGLGAGQMGEALAMGANQMNEMNMLNANRLSDQLGLGAAQMGAGFGMGGQQLAGYLGQAQAQHAAGLGLGTAHLGANLSAGAGDLARQLGLGATQLGSNLSLGAAQLGQEAAAGATSVGNTLALGASQTGDNIYQAGMQAAEHSGDIGANMYGQAWENAQSRALQAANIGSNVALGYRGLQQNAMTAGLSGLTNSANLYLKPMDILGNVGSMERMWKNQDYNNKWSHLNNYIGAVSPGIFNPAGGGVVPGGPSQWGSAIGGGIAGAGTGSYFGPVGTAIGGGLGFLGGFM